MNRQLGALTTLFALILCLSQAKFVWENPIELTDKHGKVLGDTSGTFDWSIREIEDAPNELLLDVTLEFTRADRISMSLSDTVIMYVCLDFEPRARCYHLEYSKFDGLRVSHLSSDVLKDWFRRDGDILSTPDVLSHKGDLDWSANLISGIGVTIRPKNETYEFNEDKSWIRPDAVKAQMTQTVTNKTYGGMIEAGRSINATVGLWAQIEGQIHFVKTDDFTVDFTPAFVSQVPLLPFLPVFPEKEPEEEPQEETEPELAEQELESEGDTGLEEDEDEESEDTTQDTDDIKVDDQEDKAETEIDDEETQLAEGEDVPEESEDTFQKAVEEEVLTEERFEAFELASEIESSERSTGLFGEVEDRCVSPSGKPLDCSSQTDQQALTINIEIAEPKSKALVVLVLVTLSFCICCPMAYCITSRYRLFCRKIRQKRYKNSDRQVDRTRQVLQEVNRMKALQQERFEIEAQLGGPDHLELQREYNQD